MKDKFFVNNRNKTASDKLQHVITLDSRKYDKYIVIK